MSGARPVSDFAEQLDRVLAGEPSQWSLWAARLGLD
jgi:hypothetical protein